MNQIKSFFLAFLSVISLFFFTAPVLAGGQLVSLHADTDGWISDAGYGRVIRLFIGPGFSCKGTDITFKFVDSKDGDYIMTGSGNTTYTMQEDRGPSGCGTYAKMITKNSETRFITVSLKNGDSVWDGNNAPTIRVDFDGKYHADNEYNGYSYRSSINDPYGAQTNLTPTSSPTPSAKINVWLLSQQLDGSTNRNVVIKWSAFDGQPTTSKIYGRLASNKNNWELLLEGQKGPSADIVNIRADDDYYIKVQGCLDKIGTCVDSNVLFIPRISEQGGKVIPTQTPNPTISPTPNGDNKEVEELNRKVENLQNQLDQSKKTQSVLEQRINDLVNFIKRLFPFFK